LGVGFFFTGSIAGCGGDGGLPGGGGAPGGGFFGGHVPMMCS